MLLLLGLQLLSIANHLQNASTKTENMFFRPFPLYDDILDNNLFKSLASSDQNSKRYKMDKSDENYTKRTFNNWNNLKDWSKRISTDRRIKHSFQDEAKRVEVFNGNTLPKKIYSPINHESEQLRIYRSDQYLRPNFGVENDRIEFNSDHKLSTNSFQLNNITRNPVRLSFKSETKNSGFGGNYDKTYGVRKNNIIPNIVSQNYRTNSPIVSMPQKMNEGFNANKDQQFSYSSESTKPNNYPISQNNDYGNGNQHINHQNDQYFDDIDPSDIKDENEDNEDEEDDDDIPEYTYKEDETPYCALNTDHSYCDEDSEYPEEAMQYAIDKQTNVLTQIMPDSSETFDLVDGISKENDEKYGFEHYFNDNSFSINTSEETNENHLNELYFKEGGYICPSYVSYIQPKRARNNDGMWRIIINLKDSYRGTDYKQHIRIEECIETHKKCSFTANYYNSECIQKFNNHRLLVWTPEKGIHLDVFRLPIACSCHFRANY